MPYIKEEHILKLHSYYHGLKALILKVYARLFPEKPNLSYLVFSFVIALFLWQSVAGGEREQEQYDLRLMLNYRNLPEGLTIRDRTDSVFARVRGTAQDYRELDRREISYNVDLSSIDRGANMLALDVSEIPSLSKFEIISTNPSHILVVAEKYSEKTVELEAIPSREQLPNGFHVQDIKVSPTHVIAKGGESIIGALERLNVPLTIGIENTTGVYSQSVAVQARAGIEIDPPIVEVHYRLEPRMEEVTLEREIKSLSYHKSNATNTGKKAIVKVYCPANRVYEKALLDKVEVYLEPITIAGVETRLRASLPTELRLISIERK